MSGRDEVMRTTPGVKLTYDDYLLFPDDGKRHELIDGEHYVTPSPYGRLEVLTTKNVQGAPHLVVEIGSPSTRQRDETITRKLYERFGVEEYWVIDPEIETIAVYRPVGESYQHVLELAVERNDTLTTPLLPGLQAPLRRVFKD
jgi:Uma2 family endonuclease